LPYPCGKPRQTAAFLRKHPRRVAFREVCTRPASAVLHGAADLRAVDKAWIAKLDGDVQVHLVAWRLDGRFAGTLRSRLRFRG
jgi:hypothetical protein